MNNIVMYSNCIPVRGFTRSVIYDLQKQEQYYIPNSLFDLLNSHNTINIKKYHENLDKIEIDVFNNYIDFLATKELAFFCPDEEIKYFPKLDLCWFYPSSISNAIIEIQNINSFDYKSILASIENLGCKHLQIKFTSIIQEKDIDLLASYVCLSRIVSIELLINYYEKYDWLKNILNKHKRIDRIIVYNAPVKKVCNEKNNKISLSYLPLKMDYPKDCGKIESYYFMNNITLFTESQHYNTCLNRKISIDVDGNIRETTIEEAVNKSGFKDLWGIRKDDIDVCKDCEFRYMCTDCRCFIKNTEDIYSQPEKCGYNPYIAKWNNEEGYITVEEWRKQNPNWEKKAKRKPLVKVPQKVE